MDGFTPSDMQHSFVCPFWYGPNQIRNNRYQWKKNKQAYPTEWDTQKAEYNSGERNMPPTPQSVYDALIYKRLIKEIERPELPYAQTHEDDDFVLEEQNTPAVGPLKTHEPIEQRNLNLAEYKGPCFITQDGKTTAHSRLITFESIAENMQALTHMFGQGFITKSEFITISQRMGISVNVKI